MARFNPAAAADYSDAASFDDAEIAPSAAAVIPDVAGTAEAGNAFETVPPWTSAAPSASLQRQSAPNPINATAADDDFYNATPDTFDAPFDTDTGFDDSPDAFQTAAPLSDVPSATVRRQAVSSSDQAANDPQDSSADDSASVRRTADHPSARTVDPISRDNARAAAIFRAEQPATPDTALPTQGEAPTRARPQNARPAQGMADRPPIQRSVQPDQQTFADSVSPRMVQTDDASVYDAADDPFYGDEEYTRADTMAEFDQMYQSAARADTVAEFDQPYQSAARADVQRTANDDDWMADDDRYEVPFDSAPADFDNQRDYRQQPPSTIARDVQPSRENTPHAGTPTADVINVSQAAPVRRVTAADNDPDDGPEPSATFDPSADFADAPEHYQNDALPDISYSPVPPADNSAARAIQRYAAPDDYASFDVPTNVDSAPDQPPAAPTLNWPRLRRKARTAQPAAVDSTVQRQSAADQMALTLQGDTLSSDAVPADRSASPEEVDMLMLLGLPPTARIERGPAQVVEAPAEAVQRSSQAGVQRLISEPTSSPSANDGGFTSVNPNEGMNPTSSTVMANNPLQQTESISRDDVEQIAQEVYRQLRNRLRIERERTKGGS